MPAAIRPYSMAVAPDSSFKKRAKSLDISNQTPVERRLDSLTASNCSRVKSIAKKPVKKPASVNRRALNQNSQAA
jgi:hypothetical protein